MHRSYFPIIVLVFTFLFFSEPAKATHLMGAEITYTQIDSNKFEVTMRLYRDCNGVSAPAALSINYSSIQCNISSGILSLNKFSVRDITPVCSTVQSACNGQGGLGIGIEEHVYKGVLTLPGVCEDLTFSFSSCCRNNAISNLVNPGSQSMLIVSKIDLTGQPVSINNSPVFENSPTVFGVTNQIQTFDFHAIDIDGDSLFYTLVAPLGTSGNPIAYNPGFSPTQPLSGIVTFNNSTGLMTVMTSISQVAVVTVLVEEFRNGNKIGEIRRDMQINIMSDTNSTPLISGIDSSGSYEITVLVGDTVNFEIFSFDADTVDTLIMYWDSSISNAKLNIIANQHPKGSFYWIPDSTNVQFGPHLFKVFVRDDHCPVNSIKTRYFKVFVLADDTTEVWPGDANNDYKADLFDALPIGIAYGQTGFSRMNATTNWTGQISPNWPTSFISGLNHKYADCNGDGTIDSSDIGVIDLNYGLTHNRLSFINQNAANADLKMEFQRDTLYPGVWVTADILLGDNQNPINDLYGIAFSIVYDPLLINSDSIYLDVSASWVGQQQNNMLLFSKNISSQSVLHNTLVRTNQGNVSGSGLIAMLRFKIVDQLPQPTNDLQFAFANQIITDVNENLKQVTTSVDSVVVVDQNVGVFDLKSRFNIYPNPVDNVLVIESDLFIQEVELINLDGKVMLATEGKGNNITFNTSSIPPGQYFLRINSEKGKLTKSVVIVR
jgi:Secretion system C-terminal sorting domain